MVQMKAQRSGKIELVSSALGPLGQNAYRASKAAVDGMTRALELGPLLFLASGASDFYTGYILYADGGCTAG